MKTNALFLIVIFLCFGLTQFDAYAQDTLVRKENLNFFKDTFSLKKIYFTRVKLTYENAYVPAKGHGILFSLSDTSITISNANSKKSLFSENHNLFNIPIVNIESLTASRKGSVLIGALIGAAAGFALGCLLMEASNNEAGSSSDSGWGISLTFAPWMGGVVMAIPGAIIGTIVGAIHVSLPTNINGDIIKYNKHKAKLKKYAFTTY